MTRLVVQLLMVFGAWMVLVPPVTVAGMDPASAGRWATLGAGLTLVVIGLRPARRRRAVPSTDRAAATGSTSQRPSA